MRKSLTSLTCNLFSTHSPISQFYRTGFISFALMMLVITAFAQNGTTVRGIVKDNSGIPMADVSVTVKGTTTGVTTDQTGTYQIVVPNPKSTLIISSVGYQSQEIPLNNRNNLDV